MSATGLAALAALIPGHDFDALVIGGSAGAFSALQRILPALDCPSLVAIVVLHQSPHGGDLADLFAGLAAMPCATVEDKLPAAPGTVYFAPPAYHLLLERDGHFALSLDPPVNYSRPSIDVTFESASDAYGARVAGLVLTGASDDGARGLRTLAARGGIAIAQDPSDAEVPLMPQAATRLAAPRATLRLDQMAALFGAWSNASGRPS